MKNAPSAITHCVRQVFRLVALATALAAPLVYADEYSDVNQLVRSGKLAEALTKADQYLVSKPRDPQMRFLKGVIQTESGKPTDAIGTFVKLTEDYPELPEPYNNLAVLYASQGQYDKARAALEMAIRTNPSYATAHENLGDVYAKLASQAYSKALQLDSSNTGVQPKLALIRDLFAPGAKGVRPTAAAATPAPQATAATPATKPAASAPAPATAPQPPATAAAAAAKPATPPAATNPTPPSAPTPAAPSGAEKDVEAAVTAWAAAWSAKDMARYLAAYGKDFDPPGEQTRKAWEEDRRSRIVGKSRIAVKLSNLNIEVSGNKAVAKFRQDYHADSLNVSSRKTLDLVKSGDRWVIVKESTGA
jgi:tetratricopeptide (TPR) repeat protein